MNKQGSEFDRGDLIAHICENTQVVDHGGGGEPYPEDYRIPKDVVSEVVRAVPETISQALAEFGRVEIAGFGVFALQEREPDSGVLPDGSPWSTPHRFKIVFRPAPAFCATVSEATGMPVY
jgi:nucleoid DNA-binding protein